MLGLVAGSLLPFGALASLIGLLGLAELRRRQRSGWRAAVLLAVAAAVGYLVWQDRQDQAARIPPTRIGIARAYAEALAQADWDRGSALMAPGLRGDWGSLFLFTGERLRADGVRVRLCEDAELWMECALDGGGRYRGALMIFLDRTHEGWRVAGFLELGGPPQGSGEGAG